MWLGEHPAQGVELLGQRCGRVGELRDVLQQTPVQIHQFLFTPVEIERRSRSRRWGRNPGQGQGAAQGVRPGMGRMRGATRCAQTEHRGGLRTKARHTSPQRGRAPRGWMTTGTAAGRNNIKADLSGARPKRCASYRVQLIPTLGRRPTGVKRAPSQSSGWQGNPLKLMGIPPGHALAAR